MEVVSTNSASDEAFNHTKEASMRLASPMKLYKGSWGAWVDGEGVEPGMLLWVRTRSGKSWFSKVKEVLWEGTSKYTGEIGAVCERIDKVSDNDLIAMWSNILTKLVPRQVQKEATSELLDANWQGRVATPKTMLPAIEPILPMGAGAESRYHQEGAYDENIRTRFSRERVRQQRKRMPSQVASLRDYSRLYGRDSAY